MFLGGAWLVLALAGACAAERWRWEDENAGAASTRIDTKVRFLDDESRRYRQNKVQADEIKEPTDTEGFYNRPTTGAGSGRYPVRSEPHRQRLITATEDQNFRRFQESDGTLDSFQYCKCVSTPECTPRTDLPQACASGMYLCCYKRPSKNGKKIDVFNELEDERSMILPSHDKRGGVFAEGLIDESPAIGIAPFGSNSKIGPSVNFRKMQQRPTLVGPDGATGVIGPNIHSPTVLIGPGGPSEAIGPNHRDNRILIGPGGPTGEIGPDRRNPGVLVGPTGPSGHIGPMVASNPGILVGPEGPTGQIGAEETAQRAVLVGPGGPGPQQYGQRQLLVGPGGPTGVIGPRGRARQPMLVGPSGPTGLIGPYDYRDNRGAQTGLLVGPGGPTGVIGPGRRLLVGPGGPTGHIGPRGYGQFSY